MELAYLHLRPEQALPDLTVRPFRVVIVLDRAASEEWRNHVATWLIAGGCLYAVTWGVDCEAWHDSVDWANLDAFNFGDIPDDRFVMTTWHADEPLSEAFWFAGNCASHPSIELSATIILHIAEEARSSDTIRAYQDSQSLANEA